MKWGSRKHETGQGCLREHSGQAEDGNRCAVTLFSKIDSCALEIAWLITGADLAEKKKLAKAHAANNLRTFEDAIRQLPNVERDDIFSACRELLSERNLIAHGVWLVDDLGIPHVSWHSRFLESDDYAIIESFSYDRFASFLERGRAVLDVLNEIKRNLEEILPGKWPAKEDM